MSQMDLSTKLHTQFNHYILPVTPFKINIQKWEGLSTFENLGFDFSVLYPKKSGLSKK